MDRLEPCPSCQRHVRVSETSCPFCGMNVQALSALPERAMPAARLGRAALFAFGVTAAAATASTVGCVDEPDPDVDEDGDGADGNPIATKDAGESVKDAGGTDPAPSKDAGGGSALRDAGTVVALYGLAVPGGLQGGGGQPGGAFIPDASVRDKDAGASDASTSDAGRKKDAGPGGDLGGAVALYGLAPAPPGNDLTKDGGIIRRDAGGIVPLYGLAVPAADEQSTEG
jgi:hypothetical protein